MPAISAAHQKQIETAIAAGTPDAAFSILRDYADLRHADMPPVSKEALASIAKNSGAVKAFVLATASTSSSVRRFCRKYLPKLGEAAASPLLALAVESLDPFRPGVGLLGSFGGLVSPLAKTILDEKMNFELKGENYAYSEAGRYGKDVMDDLVFLVGATSHDNLIRFAEYQWGCDRIDQRPNAAPRDWPHEDYFPPWTHHTVQEILAKNSRVWGEALVRWSSGRTLLLDESSEDPVVIELARRVRDQGKEWQALVQERLIVQYTRNFFGLSQEHRMALYRNICALIHTMPVKLKPYFERTAQEYREKFPAEAKEADRAAAAGEPLLTATLAAPASRPSSKSAKNVAAGADMAEPKTPVSLEADTDSAAEPSAGPGSERALLSMLRLASHARLPRLHATINRSIHEDLRDDRKPQSGGSDADERTLAEVHRAILEHRTQRPGATHPRPRFGEDTTYVPNQVLESGPFAKDLTDILIRMIDSDHTHKLAAAAATLLPPDGLRRFGEAWAAGAKPSGPFYEDYANQILDPLNERRLTPVALLHFQFSREYEEFDIALGEVWQRAIAMLYIRGGAAGREAALDLLARYPYPKEINEYSNRRDFYDAHQSTIWAAWRRRDAELLALAFERFAIPYFWKGSKALLSMREPFYACSGYAATSNTGEGHPLDEVWALAASTGRGPAIVKAALQHAELCEAPRTYLGMAASEHFAGLGDDVLALLESSNPAVLATGLEVLSKAPEIVADRADEAVSAAARALSSTRTGAAKDAAAALAALGKAHPQACSQAYAALADALGLEAAPVLQAILKSIKQLPGKLPSDARKRVIELSKSDPAKFEKLAKPLLAA